MTDRQIDTYFDADEGYFLLELSRADVGLGKEPLNYRGKTFYPKDEVHITIFGGPVAERLAQAMTEKGALESKISRAIEETEWHYELQDEWYHVRREDEDEPAESIIRMAEVLPLEAFYKRVEELSGVEIPARPTHVTLYTWNDPEGIGIANQEQFDKRVVGSLSPEELT